MARAFNERLDGRVTPSVRSNARAWSPCGAMRCRTHRRRGIRGIVFMPYEGPCVGVLHERSQRSHPPAKMLGLKQQGRLDLCGAPLLASACCHKPASSPCMRRRLP